MQKILGFFICFFLCIAGHCDEKWDRGTVWILGDSHVGYCFTNLERTPWPNHMPREPVSIYEASFFDYQLGDQKVAVPFMIVWFQFRTMHRIGREGLKECDVNSFGINNNDVVVFCFGSIDRDSHIAKQMSFRKEDEIIDTLCRNYIKTIIMNKRQFDNLKVVVVPPPPIFVQDFMFDIEIYNGKSYDFMRDHQVRLGRRLHEELRKFCLANELDFLDIWEMYSTEHGDLDRKFAEEGDHHILPQYNVPIKEALIRTVLKKPSLCADQIEPSYVIPIDPNEGV